MMGTRRARTTRTLPASGDPLILGAAAAPSWRQPGERARRLVLGATAAAPTVLGLHLPRLGASRRPRWPRVLVALIALYAGFLTAADIVRLAALDGQIAAVEHQLAAVDAQD